MAEPDWKGMLLSLCGVLDNNRPPAALMNVAGGSGDDAYRAYRRWRDDPARRPLKLLLTREARREELADLRERLARLERDEADTPADEASATAPAQPADPAGLGSRIEASTPHPIPHESPKEG